MTASLREQVQKQVEFYFSDSNFRRDKFLQQETAKHADSYVPFAVLFTFKKLAALTTDAAELAAALEDSQIVELNETKDALRRKHALPEVDDSASRTLVLAGLGQLMPTIDDIKAALAVIPAEPLYIHRKVHARKFSGVVRVEFADVDTLQRVQAAAESIVVNQHKPDVLTQEQWQKLSADEQVEFEKAVHAMLVAKDVPSKPLPVYYELFQPLFDADQVLKARIKFVPETKELYVLFTQVALAERALALLQSEHQVVVNDTTLEFSLVTDKDAIAARPRSKKSDKKDAKRKRDFQEGRCIYVSQIATKVRVEDIKKLVAQVEDADTKLPYIEYNGLDTAMFYVPDADKATVWFQKLSALSDEQAELGGKRVQFHLLKRNEELQVEVQYERGLIVGFDGVTGEISRDDIKDAVNEKLGEKAGEGEGVAYIKYDRNDAGGFLRVTSAALAQDVLDLFKDGGLEVNGVTIPQAQLVEGDEEKQFWVDARKARTSRFNQTRKGKSNMKRGRNH